MGMISVAEERSATVGAWKQDKQGVFPQPVKL